MDCVKCKAPIEGARYENGVRLSTDRRDPRSGEYVHFECVDQPARLTGDEFQKWSAHEINSIKLAVGAQFNIHNDLVDALEELHPGTRAAYEQILLRGETGTPSSGCTPNDG